MKVNAKIEVLMLGHGETEVSREGELVSLEFNNELGLS